MWSVSKYVPDRLQEITLDSRKLEVSDFEPQRLGLSLSRQGESPPLVTLQGRYAATTFLFTCKPLNDTRCKTLIGHCGRVAMSWYLRHGTKPPKPSAQPTFEPGSVRTGAGHDEPKNGGTLQRPVAFYYASACPEISGLKG